MCLNKVGKGSTKNNPPLDSFEAKEQQRSKDQDDDSKSLQLSNLSYIYIHAWQSVFTMFEFASKCLIPVKKTLDDVYDCDNRFFL